MHWFNKFLLPVVFLFVCNNRAGAQEYSYVHYTVQNGLAGANVYAIYQDNNKFLWFGTETGVSRFDGTHFKNLTTTDGLPDNEILEIFGDQENRIWFVPFKKTLCYYYNGKIFNQQNDTILAKIKLTSNVSAICGDKYKNTWILEENGLYLITANNQLHYYDKINNAPFSGPVHIGLNSNKELILIAGNGVYNYKNDQFQLLFTIESPAAYRTPLTVLIDGDYVVWRSGEKTVCAQSLTTQEMHCFEYPANTLRFSAPGNGTIAINTTNGSILYNPLTKKKEYTFLKNNSVSKVLIDHEGSWWFTTLGNGIYQLLSTGYKNFIPEPGLNTDEEIFSITKMGNKLVMGTTFSQLLVTSDFKNTAVISLPSSIKNKYNRVTVLLKTPHNQIICGTDEMLGVLDSQLHLKNYFTCNSVKYIHYRNEDSIYAATSNDLTLFNLSNLRQNKIIWKERSTAIALYKNTLFVGTLNGLYHLPQNADPVFMGDFDTLFTRRVSSMIISKDSTLWIGTYDGGIASLKNGAIRDTITTAQGLTSNICRALFLSDNILWAGTDKGICRIDLSKKPFTITPFTVNNGLLSNQINAIYAEGDTVYVATQNGITYFNEKTVDEASQCFFIITNAYRGMKELAVKDKYTFNHAENNFRIEYAGITFKSGGDINYHYKLNGLDTTWKTTRQTSLEFLSLPAGHYTLSIYAVNAYGIKSEVKKISIIIEPAFYETNWFYLLVILLTAGLTWILVAFYNRNRRKKERISRETNQRITELEQMALRAQMNPHFIFNCLNSIQQFVYDKDIQTTNKFISGFARLIRQTLDNSARTMITVAEEMDYLTSYLALEKMRFENKFEFSVTAAHDINTDDYRIPVMLLQPYVENSIRHGIRYKKGNDGFIKVIFSKTSNELICTIEDNGIGRARARELKSRQHIEYQSKGMMLTSERMEAMNKMLEEKLRVEIEDLLDKYQQPSGTKIIIHFPLSFVQNS